MDEDQIAQVIQNYMPGEVPEDVRQVIEDYFTTGSGVEQDSSSSDHSDSEDQPQPLVQENVQELNIADIPVVLPVSRNNNR